MTPSRIRFLAIGAALLVFAFGYSMLTRTVTILADGELLTVSTRAITVGGALDAAGLDLGEKDQVEPGSFSLLHNGLVIKLERASFIQLETDGQTYSIVSAEKDPAILLKQWGLIIEEADRLLLSGRPILLDDQLPSWPIVSLELRRPVTVSLNENGQTISFESSASTLGEALSEHGINIQTADRLDPGFDAQIDGPISADLVRAQSLEINVAGETLAITTAASTVGEALAEAGIALQGLDRSEPAEGEAIPVNRQIEIVRVAESVLLEQEIIPNETEWQEDPEAELDTISIVQLGQDGVQAARVRVRFENGVEIARQEEGERVLVEPQTQINGYGTQIVIRTAVVDGITIEYYRAVQVYVTSYSPCRSGVEACLYGTSSGLPVQKGTIATWLNWYHALKFATIYVPGYGPGTIGDVGAYRDRSVPWIDVAYSDDEWIGWSQYVTIYFTTPVPANVPLIWPP